MNQIKYSNTLKDSNKQFIEKINVSELNQLTKPFKITINQQFKFHLRNYSPKSTWTAPQMIKYTVFIVYYNQLFQKIDQKVSNWNIFKVMSEFVESRDCKQCRSYHIKLLDGLGSIQNFLNKLTNFKSEIKYYLKKYSVKLESMEKINTLNQIKQRKQEKFKKILIQNENIECQSYKFNKYIHQGIKNQKIQNMKTADSYVHQVNPMNTFQPTIISNKSQFSQFQQSSVSIKKQSKQQLPCFDNQQQRLQHGPYNLTNNIIYSQNSIQYQYLNNNFNPYSQQFSQQYNESLKSISSYEGIQNNKQFYNMSNYWGYHYYLPYCYPTNKSQQQINKQTKQ